jgi:hypothetical protein
MTSFRIPAFKPTVVLAALSLGLAALGAQAAVGDRPGPVKESLVKAGMSTQEVLAALGRPAQIAKFMNEPGPTWTYTIDVGAENARVFDVDFDRDGKVASSSERIQDLERRFRH